MGLTQEVRANGVQAVATKLVVSLHDLQDIKLQPAVHLGLFRVTLSIRLRAEVRVFDFRLDLCPLA